MYIHIEIERSQMTLRNITTSTAHIDPRSLGIHDLPEVVYGWMRVRLLEMALMMMAMATWYVFGARPGGFEVEWWQEKRWYTMVY